MPLPCPDCGRPTPLPGRFGLCRSCEHWELYEESWDRDEYERAHPEPEPLFDEPDSDLWDGSPDDPEAA